MTKDHEDWEAEPTESGRRPASPAPVPQDWEVDATVRQGSPLRAASVVPAAEDWCDRPDTRRDAKLPDAPLVADLTAPVTWEAEPTELAGDQRRVPTVTIRTRVPVERKPTPPVPPSLLDAPPLYEGPLVESSEEARRTRSIDEQMYAMFGGRKFSRREPSQRALTKMHDARRSRSISVGRIATMVVFVALTGFSVFVLGYGMQQKSAADVETLARELDHLAQVGALENVDGVLGALQDAEIQSPDKVALVARAEALLYRYHDAESKRLGQVARKLEVVAEHRPDDAIVIRGIMASAADRIAMLEDLTRIAETKEDAEAAFLVASALSRAGSYEHADRYFERSLDLEPSHLEHLAAYAEHKLLADRLDQAESLLDTMREVSPSSLWTRVIAEALGRAQKTDRHQIETTEEGPSSRVAEAHALLMNAIARHEDGDRDAIQDVDRAIERVNAQPPFLIDYADRLLSIGWYAAARRVVECERFPETALAGRAVLGRLQLAEGDAVAARATLLAVVREGYRDPVTGMAHVEAMSAAGATKGAVKNAAKAVARAWPERTDLADAASQLDGRGDASAPKKKAKKRRRRRRRR